MELNPAGIARARDELIRCAACLLGTSLKTIAEGQHTNALLEDASHDASRAVALLCAAIEMWDE